MSKQFYEPHGLDFEMVLSSPIGGTEQINEMVAEINWFEDVYSPFMKIEVMIVDGLGLFDKLPITGDETLVFTYKNPNETQYVQIFHIYKVSQRITIKERTHAYVLHGISIEGINNSLQQVYDPYVKQNPIAVIQNVFQKYLAATKSLAVDAGSDSSMIYSKIGSGQQPAKFIYELCSEIQSSSHPECSSYLFWENRDQFNLRTISSLFKQAPKYQYYLGEPADKDLFEGTAKGKPEAPAKIISQFSFKDNVDHIGELMDGQTKNEVNLIDPILKRFKVNPIEEKDKYQFDYVKDFDKLEHMQRGGGSKWMADNGRVATGKRPGASHRRLLYTQLEEEGETYPSISYLGGRASADPILSAPRKRQKFINKHLHERRNLSSHTVDITTPGTTDLMAGDHLLLYIAQPTQIKTEMSKYLLQWDPDPNFIVTSIRHVYRIAEENYFTILSCSKESYPKQPSGLPFDHGLYG